MLQPTGRKADCITGRVSVCFGAELWRRATWKHSPGKLHAFSSSFAQSTGITGSRHSCMLMCARWYVSLCLFTRVHVYVYDYSYCRYLEQLSQSTFQENWCVVGSYLAIAKHDNPHQHHIDLCSQRLVMVDLIHLESHRETHIFYTYFIMLYKSAESIMRRTCWYCINPLINANKVFSYSLISNYCCC